MAIESSLCSRLTAIDGYATAPNISLVTRPLAPAAHTPGMRGSFRSPNVCCVPLELPRRIPCSRIIRDSANLWASPAVCLRYSGLNGLAQKYRRADSSGSRNQLTSAVPITDLPRPLGYASLPEEPIANSLLRLMCRQRLIASAPVRSRCRYRAGGERRRDCSRYCLNCQTMPDVRFRRRTTARSSRRSQCRCAHYGSWTFRR